MKYLVFIILFLNCNHQGFKRHSTSNLIQGAILIEVVGYDTIPDSNESLITFSDHFVIVEGKISKVANNKVLEIQRCIDDDLYQEMQIFEEIFEILDRDLSRHTLNPLGAQNDFVYRAMDIDVQDFRGVNCESLIPDLICPSKEFIILIDCQSRAELVLDNFQQESILNFCGVKQ